MKIVEWLHTSYYGVTPMQAIATVLALFAAAMIILIVMRFLRRLLLANHKRLHVSYESVMFSVRLIHAALWLAVLLIMLSSWGVSVSGVWTALLSVVTLVGVGFLAVWTMISNVTAQLFISIWRPYHLGATVEMLPEGIRGKVVDTNMMFTVMREESGAMIYVPNNLFFQKMFRVTGQPSQSAYEFYERDLAATTGR